MKNATINFLILSLFFVVFTACSPNIIGVWTVESFETVTQGVDGVSARNIGTITFEKDGSGTKDLSFTIFGVTKDDKAPFNWMQENNLPTISGQDSEFAKTWIVIEDQKKSQKMKSTDGADQVQILELRK